jgi:hypothetical protein
MRRIYSNFYGVDRYFKDALRKREHEPDLQPWQVVEPLINAPGPMHFSSDEMGMLLSLRDDDIFNGISEMDELHNALMEGIAFLSRERRALTDILKTTTQSIEGRQVAGIIPENQLRPLRPTMLEVNSLIESLRANAENHVRAAGPLLQSLADLLKRKLDLRYKLEVVQL